MIEIKISNNSSNIFKDVLDFFISLSDENINYIINLLKNNQKIIFLYEDDYELNNNTHARGYELSMLELISFIRNNGEEKYIQLLNRFNLSKDSIENVMETTDGMAYPKEIQNYIDNDWKLDESIYNYIFNNMNQDYTIEEKIAYIYIKLCMLLEFEASYVIDESMNSRYDKYVLEGINLEQKKILCSDFTKICTKLFNSLDPNIDARCVRCGKSDRAHEFIVLQINDKDIKIEFEPIDAIEHFNDLTRAKLGLDLAGIKYIKDENKTFKNAIDRAYKDILGDKVITTEDLISEYEQINISLPIINFDNSMIKFIQNIKNKNIKGNELIIVFMELERLGYFGTINYSLISFKREDDYKERAILIEVNGITYYFRTETQDVFPFSKEELNNYFSKDIITYEDEKYIINGVGKEVVRK